MISKTRIKALFSDFLSAIVFLIALMAAQYLTIGFQGIILNMIFFTGLFLTIGVMKWNQHRTRTRQKQSPREDAR